MPSRATPAQNPRNPGDTEPLASRARRTYTSRRVPLGRVHPAPAQPPSARSTHHVPHKFVTTLCGLNSTISCGLNRLLPRLGDVVCNTSGRLGLPIQTIAGGGSHDRLGDSTLSGATPSSWWPLPRAVAPAQLRRRYP